MHYYKKNIGDYHKKTGRLSMLEHGAYTLLIDSCYDRERFPTKEEAIKWTWARTTEEIMAVEFVLSRFFVEDEEGRYVQSRINEELDAYKAKAETNQRIAREREKKRRAEKALGKTVRAEISTYSQRTVNGTSEKSNEPPPNQEPRTNNHKPITNLKNNGSPPVGDETAPVEKSGLDKPAKTPKPKPKPKPKPERQAKYSADDFAMAEVMAESLAEQYPSQKADLPAWADCLRMMREIDGLELADIESLWTWCRHDDFWRTNIRAPTKFRQRKDGATYWDILSAQRQRSIQRVTGSPPGSHSTRDRTLEQDLTDDSWAHYGGDTPPPNHDWVDSYIEGESQ